ncbi:hypothetical protein [Bacillus halotolerans]|nr:hypothetical protein [Bacillus halotolerans]
MSGRDGVEFDRLKQVIRGGIWLNEVNQSVICKYRLSLGIAVYWIR